MADDRDHVLVIHEFDSVDTAGAFLPNPELLGAMQHGGVKGEPRIEFYDYPVGGSGQTWPPLSCRI